MKSIIRLFLPRNRKPKQSLRAALWELQDAAMKERIDLIMSSDSLSEADRKKSLLLREKIRFIGMLVYSIK